MFKVVIIEDEDIIRKGISFMIDWQLVNCQVIGEAKDGVTGLSLIEKKLPDIVITDIRMPLLSGIEMLRKAKSFHTFETIIISGYSDFEYAKQAIDLSVNKYLLKPIDQEELTNALLQITSTKKIKNNNEFPLLNINYEPNNNYNEYANNVIKYIHHHFKEDISLFTISNDLNVSTTHLSNNFKKATNITIGDFINRYRIKKSLDYINTSNLLVYEIAKRVGFNDYKYFTSIFKKYTNMSPSKYKKIKA